MREKVDNQFANGFFKDDPLEAMLIRQSAYCLSLGFSLQYIRQVQAPEYERLLNLSKVRKAAHHQRQEEYRKEHGPKARLPFNACCGEETHMCRVMRQIKKDVPRTTGTFNMSKFDFPFDSGMNPIFNILVAYAETDK